MVRIIDATGTQGYTPSDGNGPAACISMDGAFEALVKEGKVNPEKSSNGNDTVSFTLVVQDSDPADAKGAVVYDNFPISGKDAKDRWNVRKLIDMCLSAGRQDLADKIIGKKFDADEIVAALVGKRVYPTLMQQLDTFGDREPRVISRASFYIAKGKEKYDEMKSTGANFRRQPRPQQKRPGAGAPANATNGVGGSTVVATDSIAADV